MYISIYIIFFLSFFLSREEHVCVLENLVVYNTLGNFEVRTEWRHATLDNITFTMYKIGAEWLRTFDPLVYLFKNI